jgi:hypothetical protein
VIKKYLIIRTTTVTTTEVFEASGEYDDQALKNMSTEPITFDVVRKIDTIITRGPKVL